MHNEFCFIWSNDTSAHAILIFSYTKTTRIELGHLDMILSQKVAIINILYFSLLHLTMKNMFDIVQE